MQLSTCCRKLAWVLLTAGATNGHPLWLETCIQSVQLTTVRAMCFYTLVPRPSQHPSSHTASIRWGLPRTGSLWFLSVRRNRQKFLASVGFFWFNCVLDVRHLCSGLVPACCPFASDPCQLWARKFFFTLISMPHHVVNSCHTSSKVCIPSGVWTNLKDRDVVDQNIC